MSVITREFEVSSSLPADKLFKLCLDFDTIAPKIEPQAFKAIDLIKGDGGVGSIKRTTYGDAVPFTSAKYKIDAIDARNFSATYTVFEVSYSVVFKGKGDAKPTEETLNQFKELFKNTFKAHEAYAIAHPEVY
ncbi:root allergen protein-like protein [Tanacetum coccineum]